ncbi:hypothetical protein BKA56DRAFT_714598 [Ilyonectria sp. MPI-CAGE-AT-0026]|nr:hypothetical protein BKA56DRAFT_714598 [Ilyonectria sp. MPI-CAGE-AT-0026]
MTLDLICLIRGQRWIRQALRQPRASLSPSQFSDDRLDSFQRADAPASKESQVTADVIPIIEGNIEDRKCVARQVPFTNFHHLTDGTLVPGPPKLYGETDPFFVNRLPM